jgi:SAM-dependent methyltransferase
MMSNGAKRVDFADISPTNIESTTRNLKSFGFDNFSGHLTSLEKLPFKDESFDFVWCNGVIMHTHNPDACLRELARVLKIGGRAWIYVYGSGGAYWYAVRRYRALLADIPAEACIAALRIMGYANRYVAEYLDDWKVPYLRTYTDADFGARLADFGFERTRPLPYGVVYDTSHRRTLFPQDTVWLGEGDLRYLVTKTGSIGTGGKPLSDSEYGSDAPFDPKILALFAARFDELSETVSGHPMVALAACAKIQFALREILSRDGVFAVDDFEAKLVETLEMAGEVVEKLTVA